MVQVKVCLDKWLEGRGTSASILTRVYPLDPPRKPLSMMIAAGPSTAYAALLDLPSPGKYTFEAYLPNGGLVTKTVTIHEGANDPIVLRGTDSPHEWLSWQHFSGYSPAEEPARRKQSKRTSRSRSVTRSEGAKAAVRSTRREIVHATSFQIPPLRVVTHAHPEALPAALLAVWKGASAETLRWTPLNVPPRPGSTAPMTDERLRLAAYLYEQGPWQEGVRYYGLVDSPEVDQPLLAVLPAGWRETGLGQYASIDVMVDARDAEAADREWPVRVAVVVRDHVMTSVLGYLSSGDLTTAAQAAETGVNLLFNKGDNPIAAAGGAYALVRQPIDSKKPPIWVPWLSNLRNWFPWLPDGAILDGWAYLNGIGRKPDLEQAAVAFVAAVERGLPYYSYGARLLFDGLTRVEATLPKRNRPKGLPFAAEFARRMALRVDLRQPFTVVRLG